MQNQSIRVIIVDDHELVRQTWKMLLHGQNGINVIKECKSGQEAIEEASVSRPDLMLMDINMEPVNGFEATKTIVATDPQIRIIGVSVNNQPGYARNMLQMGARGYVTKNATRAEMITAIAEVMAGKTYICREVLEKMNELK